jgi:hypothetical protein
LRKRSEVADAQTNKHRSTQFGDIATPESVAFTHDSREALPNKQLKEAKQWQHELDRLYGKAH